MQVVYYRRAGDWHSKQYKIETYDELAVTITMKSRDAVFKGARGHGPW